MEIRKFFSPALAFRIPAEKIAALFFLAMLGAVPFFYFPIVNDPAHSPVYVYLLLAGLPLLLQHLFSREESGIAFPNPIAVMLLSILAIGIISVGLLKNNSESRLELARLGSFAVFYFNLVLSLNRLKKPEYILGCMMIAGAGYLFFGYSDFFKYYDKSEKVYKGLYGIMAHIGHKNLLAIFLSATFPFAAYFAGNRNSKTTRFLCGIYIAAGALLIVISQSRVGLIGLVVLFLFYLAYLLTTGKKRTSRNVVLALAAVAILFFPVAQKFTFTQAISRRLISLSLLKKEGDANSQTISERIQLWKTTFALIADHPIAGVALGQWKIQAPGKNLNDTRAKYGNIIFQQPHNDLLWYFSEYGISGCIFYLALFGYCSFLIVCSIRKNKRAQQSVLLDFVLLSGQSVYFIQSLFDFPKERPVLLLVLAAYLALVTHRYIPKVKAGEIFRLTMLTGAFFTLLLFYFFSVRTSNEVLAAELLYQRRMNNYAGVLACAARLREHQVENDFTATPIPFYEGEAYFFSGNYEMARRRLEAALASSPFHLYSWSNLGGVYFAEGQTGKAVACWDKAIAIAADFAEPHLNKAICAFRQKRWEEAVDAISFNITPEDLEKNKGAVSTICRNYFYRLADSIPEEDLKFEMKKLAADPVYSLYVYKHSRKQKRAVGAQAYDELIYLMEKMNGTISGERAVSLRKKYLSLQTS